MTKHMFLWHVPKVCNSFCYNKIYTILQNSHYFVMCGAVAELCTCCHSMKLCSIRRGTKNRHVIVSSIGSHYRQVQSSNLYNHIISSVIPADFNMFAILSDLYISVVFQWRYTVYRYVRTPVKCICYIICTLITVEWYVQRYDQVCLELLPKKKRK